MNALISLNHFTGFIIRNKNHKKIEIGVKGEPFSLIEQNTN